MVKTIANKMTAEAFENLKQRVIQMSTGVDEFVYAEMLNHRNSYDGETGLRKTSFVSANHNWYSVVPVVTADQTVVNCEMITPPAGIRDRVIVYVHGAAFQRRLNDINLKTADRLCSMTGQPVCVPDYRVGIDYTYDQMVNDVAACYQYLLYQRRYAPENITILSDSSGCVTALQVIRELTAQGVPAPGNIVLWSPPVVEGEFGEERISEGKKRDITVQNNDLFSVAFGIYADTMCAGRNVRDSFPAFGDYAALKDTRILIQSGMEEAFREDACKLYEIFREICSCTLELYEGMFHNFQTYFSVCEMAPVCWQNMIDFLQAEYRLEKAS